MITLAVVALLCLAAGLAIGVLVTRVAKQAPPVRPALPAPPHHASENQQPSTLLPTTLDPRDEADPGSTEVAGTSCRTDHEIDSPSGPFRPSLHPDLPTPSQYNGDSGLAEKGDNNFDERIARIRQAPELEVRSPATVHEQEPSPSEPSPNGRQLPPPKQPKTPDTLPSYTTHPRSLLAPFDAKPLREWAPQRTHRPIPPRPDRQASGEMPTEVSKAAEPYVELGIPASDAARWIRAKIGPVEALAWRADHFSAESARSWARCDFTPTSHPRAATHAQPWRDRGAEPHMARRWADLGVDPPGRRDWLARGYGVNEAESMIRRGFETPATAPVRGGPETWRVSEDLIVLDIDEGDLSLAADFLIEEGESSIGYKLEAVLRNEEHVISVALIERAIESLYDADASYGFGSAGKGHAFAGPLEDALERSRPATLPKTQRDRQDATTAYGVTRSGTKIHVAEDGQTAYCGATLTLGSPEPDPDELCTRCAASLPL